MREAGGRTILSEKNLKIGLLNIESLTTKGHSALRLMERLSIDLLFLSETWTSEGQAKKFSDMVTYAMEHKRSPGEPEAIQERGGQDTGRGSIIR